MKKIPTLAIQRARQGGGIPARCENLCCSIVFFSRTSIKE